MDIPEDDSIFDDIPVDQGSCQLLGPTALIVQGLMGIFVIVSLIFKRHRESPKRPWRIWAFDVSKQVIGQMFVHGVNVLISGAVARLSSGNACVFYFLNILIDTTLGVAIIYFILHLLTYVLIEKFNLKGFESGQYGTPSSWIFWIKQTIIYVLALTTMKFLVICLFALWPGIFKLGEWMLSFLGPSDVLQVIFTMGLFPIIMNVLQFWLIDSIVKGSSSSVALPSYTPRTSTDPDHEPLFRSSSSDEDDTHPIFPSRAHDVENQRPHSRSRSRGSVSPSTSDEFNSAISQTAPASGSITPKTGETLALHAYPPFNSSIRSASTSPMSSASSRNNSISPVPKRRRRSPPPPLAFQPRSPMPPAMNDTPSLSSSVPLVEINQTGERTQDEKEWDSAWGDGETNDWAERVGEEDWTGNRIAVRKGMVDNVWTGEGGPVAT